MASTKDWPLAQGNNLNEVWRTWLHEGRWNLGPGSSDHIHVDELIRRLGRTQYDPIDDVLEAYLVLIDVLGNRTEEVMASLVIPLVVTSQSDTSIVDLLRPPDLGRIRSELDEEPPSIYLSYRTDFLRPATWSTYEKVLEWEPFSPNRSDVLFYYCVTELLDEQAQDYERRFLRKICARQYPESLRLKRGRLGRK
jgi:hypothetical protein